MGCRAVTKRSHTGLLLSPLLLHKLTLVTVALLVAVAIAAAAGNLMSCFCFAFKERLRLTVNWAGNLSFSCS